MIFENTAFGQETEVPNYVGTWIIISEQFS